MKEGEVEIKGWRKRGLENDVLKMGRVVRRKMRVRKIICSHFIFWLFSVPSFLYIIFSMNCIQEFYCKIPIFIPHFSLESYLVIIYLLNEVPIIKRDLDGLWETMLKLFFFSHYSACEHYFFGFHSIYIFLGVFIRVFPIFHMPLHFKNGNGISFPKLKCALH